MTNHTQAARSPFGVQPTGNGRHQAYCDICAYTAAPQRELADAVRTMAAHRQTPEHQQAVENGAVVDARVPSTNPLVPLGDMVTIYQDYEPNLNARADLTNQLCLQAVAGTNNYFIRHYRDDVFLVESTNARGEYITREIRDPEGFHLRTYEQALNALNKMIERDNPHPTLQQLLRTWSLD